MEECPVRRPDHRQTFFGLHDDTLVQELRAPFVCDVIEVGHEDEMAASIACMGTSVTWDAHAVSAHVQVVCAR